MVNQCTPVSTRTSTEKRGCFIPSPVLPISVSLFFISLSQCDVSREWEIHGHSSYSKGNDSFPSTGLILEYHLGRS